MRARTIYEHHAHHVCVCVCLRARWTRCAAACVCVVVAAAVIVVVSLSDARPARMPLAPSAPASVRPRSPAPAAIHAAFYHRHRRGTVIFFMRLPAGGGGGGRRRGGGVPQRAGGSTGGRALYQFRDRKPFSRPTLRFTSHYCKDKLFGAHNTHSTLYSFYIVVFHFHAASVTLYFYFVCFGSL